MGWCTTHDLDRFLTEAGGYLSSRAAENMLLLAAAQAAGTQDARPASVNTRQPDDREAGATGPGPLFGWWEPPDGGGTRGAFLHDPAEPLLIAGRAPETAASLAAALARAGRSVCGVDASAEAADAFAAAWSQRAGVATRVHRHTLVYRLAGVLPAPEALRAPRPVPGPTGRLRT